MSTEAQLEQGLLALGIDLQPSAREKLLDYAALLYKWNKTYSLRAMREKDKAVSHHLLDSLAIVLFIPTGSLLDVAVREGCRASPSRSLTRICKSTGLTVIPRRRFFSNRLPSSWVC